MNLHQIPQTKKYSLQALLLIIYLTTPVKSLNTAVTGPIQLSKSKSHYENSEDLSLLHTTPHIKGYKRIGNRGSMYYWGFYSNNNPKVDPFLIWIPENGIMTEIFYGNGPFRLSQNKVTKNENSWHNILNVIYLDAPVGQELSKAEFESMPKQVFAQAQSIIDFIFILAYQYPTFKERDLYIGGDGEQAKVIAKAAEMLSRDTIFPFNFKGIFVKSGYLDPTTYPLATTESLQIKKLLPDDYLDYGKRIMSYCQDYSQQKVYASFVICDGGYEYLRKPAWGKPTQNLLNTSSVCMSRNCNDFSQLWKQLNRNDTKRFLGISQNLKFPLKNDVRKILRKDNQYRNWSAAKSILSQLKNKYSIWYFTGEHDSYTPIQGFEQMLKKVGFDGLRDQKQTNMEFGFIKQNGNVAVIQINDGGHDITISNPEASYLLLQRFFINSQK